MPFQEAFLEVYELLKMEFSDDFEFSNAGDEGNQQNILKDIIQPIYEADIIIADLTGLNPNVLYELGIAHSFNKKTIVITQDEISQLPFDLKLYRAKDYSTHFKKFAELIEYLRTNLKGAISGSVQYSNPVKDFLSLAKIETANWFEDESVIELANDSESGFIDFLAEIEADNEELVTEIVQMNSEMSTMSAGINHGSSEIERVNKNGGSGTAAFVRKETAKVAGFISEFSRALKQHNINFNTLWDKIEKNTLGLIENKYSASEENRESLVGFFKTLKELQIACQGSHESIVSLKTTMTNNMGMQRSLNQAIRFLNEDLSNYLVFTERVCSSIDKILDKSRFLVGVLDFSEVS